MDENTFSMHIVDSCMANNNVHVKCVYMHRESMVITTMSVHMRQLHCDRTMLHALLSLVGGVGGGKVVVLLG